jgi:hypothetical protein
MLGKGGERGSDTVVGRSEAQGRGSFQRLLGECGARLEYAPGPPENSLFRFRKLFQKLFLKTDFKKRFENLDPKNAFQIDCSLFVK